MKLFFRRQGHAESEVGDERSYARIRLVLNVLCRQGGEDFRIFTDDVSEAGIRFVSQQALQADEDIELLVPMEPHQPPLAMRGRLAWVRAESEGQVMGGISFVDVDPEVNAAWVAFIARNRH